MRDKWMQQWLNDTMKADYVINGVKYFTMELTIDEMRKRWKKMMKTPQQLKRIERNKKIERILNEV